MARRYESVWHARQRRQPNHVELFALGRWLGAVRRVRSHRVLSGHRVAGSDVRSDPPDAVGSATNGRLTGQHRNRRRAVRDLGLGLSAVRRCSCHRLASPRIGSRGWHAGGSTTPAPNGAEPPPGTVLSPDGRRIAWTASDDPSRADLWIGDLQRGAVTRLTHDGLNVSPAWSLDGRTMYFSRRDGRRYQPMSIDAEGGQPSALTPLDNESFPSSVSPDGLLVAVVRVPARDAR